MKKITKDNLIVSFLETLVKWRKGDEGVILSDVMRLFEANTYNQALNNTQSKEDLSKTIDEILEIANNKMKELNEY